MTDWALHAYPALRDCTVEWVGPAEALVSRGRVLYRASGPERRLRRIAVLPAASWRAAAAGSRLMARLLRLSFYNAIPLPDGDIFFSFGRDMGVLRDGHVAAVRGAPRECRVLRSACSLEPDGTVAFGEYFANHERDSAVHILTLPPGSTRVEVAHRFSAGEVRHVHGVFRDAYDGSLWCTTGDVGAECRIMRSTDRFTTIEVVGSGDESWRSVSLVFTADAIFYGSDAEVARNHIYRLDRKSGRREQLVEVDGPVYYSHAIGDDLFFGVTAELCPSQRGRAACLWHVSPECHCEAVACHEKDRWSPRYFLPGAFYFPAGPGIPGGSYVHTIALSGVDGFTFRLARGESSTRPWQAEVAA